MADLGLDATVSGEASNSYLTLEEAHALIESLPGADDWDELEEEQWVAILIHVSRLVDAFKGWGPRKVKTQALAFPRSQDVAGEVPAGVKKAVAAGASFMAEQDLVPLKKLQGEGVTNMSVLGQTMTFEKDPSGLPAAARQELGKLYAGTSSWGAYNKGGDCRIFS